MNGLDELADKLLAGSRRAYSEVEGKVDTPYGGAFDRDLTLLGIIPALGSRWSPRARFFGWLNRWAFGRVYGVRVRLRYDRRGVPVVAVMDDDQEGGD